MVKVVKLPVHLCGKCSASVSPYTSSRIESIMRIAPDSGSLRANIGLGSSSSFGAINIFAYPPFRKCR